MSNDQAVAERIYAPGMARGWGLRVWRDMVREQLASRELIWRLFMRDFAARYRQSILGFLWALIVPVVAVATFVVMSRAGILRTGSPSVPYPLFVLTGLVLWQIFAAGVVACTTALVAGGSMVVKINFPKEVLVVSALGQVVVEFLIRLLLLATLMAVYRVTPGWGALAFPLATLPLWLLTLGTGLLLAFSNALVRDIANIVTVGMTFLMFLTPVIYPQPEAGILAEIMRMNPLSILVTAPRELLFHDTIADPGRYLLMSGVSVGVFLIGWRLFHLVETRVAERL